MLHSIHRSSVLEIAISQNCELENLRSFIAFLLFFFSIFWVHAQEPENQLPQPIIATDVTAGPAPLTVTFDASASYDPDGSIVAYEWNFGDGTSKSGISVDYTWEIPGIELVTLVVTDNEGATNSVYVLIRVENSPFATRIFSPVSYREHDAHEIISDDKNLQMPILGGSIVPLGSDGSEGGDIISGFYFPAFVGGGEIPKGAKIKDAYIQFVTEMPSSGPCHLTLYAEDANKPKAFAAKRKNISSRMLSTTSVNWRVPDWLARGDQGLDQRTPDISPIIQEIVDRPAYRSGTPISILITGTGRRYASSFDSFLGGATLVIIYSTLEDARDGQNLANASFDAVLYPNPFGHSFIVSGINAESEEMDLSMYNLHGQLILEKIGLPVESKINLPKEISPGIYTVRIKSGTQSKELKVIKY